MLSRIPQSPDRQFRVNQLEKPVSKIKILMEVHMQKLISLVIPVYNEEENVQNLYFELREVAEKNNLNCQFVLVDDGSKDRTIEKLLEVAGTDPRLKLVCFRRNFGQTAAMQAGFDHAEGDVVITLDGDLQNDPSEIPAMIKKLDEGYDLVAGWRKNRQDKFLSRKLPSRIANKLISRITKVQLHDYGCTLKAMTADVAKNIQLYGEMHRFIPAVAAEYGVKIAEVPVNHRARVAGTSKYGISRTFRVILDLLTVKFFLSFAKRPLHMFGALGMLSSLAGGLILTWLTVQRLFMHVPLANRPILMLGVMLVLIGMQFLCFGLLAEVLIRTYHESQGKSIYAVRQIIRPGRGGTAPEEMHSRKVVNLA